MLSSRSQNVLPTSGPENIFPSSTRSLAFKTPARSSKHGRAVHDENAIYGHPRTAGLTGKKNANTALFGTPYMRGPSQSQSKQDKVLRTVNKSTALSEITKRTPFNKAWLPVTPGPTFAIFNDTSVVPSARRISSTRKRLRLPRSASKSFETPETRGDHWDVSDVSIEASVIEEASETEEDLDDVEYCPPSAIEPEYDPPFEMPNYKEVGATLMSLFQQRTIPEDYDPVAECDNAELIAEMGTLGWERLELPAIPLENIFPCMIPSQVPLSVPLSSTTDNRPYTRSNTIATFSNPTAYHPVVPLVRPKGSTRVTPTMSVRKPTNFANPFPVNPIPKPLDSRITTHTRIPSLTKASYQMSPVVQTRIPTALHSRTTSVSHSRATSISHSKATSASHSRTASVPQPLSLGKRSLNFKGQLFKVPEDTVQSLLTTGDSVLGEEFLFDV